MSIIVLAAILDWFVRFPALWGAAGFVLGGLGTGFAAVFVFRRYGDSLVQINDKIIKQQDKLLEKMQQNLEMQKAHYDAEALETKTKYEAQVKEAKEEWQICRKALHDKREEWNKESLEMQLTIQDLRKRPDMSELNITMLKLVELIGKVAISLDKHDKSLESRWKKVWHEVKHKAAS